MADYQLVRGDARRIPIRDGSVHVVVCSPPYFGLRDYGTAQWEGGDPECDHRPRSSGKGSNIPQTKNPHVDYPDGASHRGGDPSICGHCGAQRIDNQIGLEPLHDCEGWATGHPCGCCFTCSLVAVGREVRRILHPSGSWWLNIGDSYVNNPGNGRGGEVVGNANRQIPPHRSGSDKSGCGLPPKNLLMVPARAALALQRDGWWLRAKPPWVKPGNAMPESVDSRPGVAHEDLYLLTKNEHYFYDAEAVRLPSAASTIERDRYTRITRGKDAGQSIYAVNHDHDTTSHPDGRNRRTSDWMRESLEDAVAYHRARAAEIERVLDKGGMLTDDDGDPLAMLVNPTSFKGSHYAVFPERLVRPLIQASTSEKGCCRECGGPWVREVERTPMVIERSGRGEAMGRFGRTQASGTMVSPASSTTLGWRPSCSCNSGPPVPCRVVDCFAGASTTGVVALALGRQFLGLDLSQSYLDMSARRLSRPHAPLPKPAARTADVSMPLFRDED